MPTAPSSSLQSTDQYIMANIGFILGVLVILAGILTFALVPKTG